MLNKINSSGSSDSWEVSDSKKERAPLHGDQYRKVERDRQKPSTKDEERSHVDEKKPRSVFELSKEKPKRVSSDRNAPSPKGKAMGKKEAKSAMMKEETSSESEVRRSSKMKGDHDLDAFAELGEQPEQEIDVSQTIDEEFPADDLDRLTQEGGMEEAPVEIADQTPDEPSEVPEKPMEAPKQAQDAAPERPRIKQSIESPSPRQTSNVQVPNKSSKTESFETKKEEPVGKKDKTKGETKGATEAGGEKGVAAAAQPPIQAPSFHTEKTQETAPAPRSATIQELAAQIIDRIQVMRKKDETSTMITLRHPPILSGATITLTASDHAKKEFNITFANLSPEAKVFLDRKLKEDSLTETLDRKGIIVHNLTTTTEPEQLIATDAGQASKDRQDQQQEQQQQQKRQQFPGEEEETA